MRHNLGLQYYQLERFPEAIEQYEELVRRGSAVASTHANLAGAYYSTGEPRRGRDLLEAYVTRYPESAAGLRYLAEARILDGELDAARAAYEKSAVLNPNAFQTRLGLWSIAVLQSRWADAEAVSKLFAAAANPFEQVLNLGTSAELRRARGRSREALALSDRLVRHPNSGPDNRAFAHMQQALHLLRQKRAAEALAHAEQAATNAVKTMDELPPIATLAMALATAGRHADADRTLAHLASRAKLWPGPAGERMVQWARGEIARARGDRNAAAAELTKAQSTLPLPGSAVGPPTLYPTLWFAAATANAEAGRDDEAARLFERLQQRLDHIFDLEAYARSFYLLGGIYEHRGDATRAREQYTRFLDLWRDGDLERGWVAEAERKTRR